MVLQTWRQSEAAWIGSSKRDMEDVGELLRTVYPDSPEIPLYSYRPLMADTIPPNWLLHLADNMVTYIAQRFRECIHTEDQEPITPNVNIPVKLAADADRIVDRLSQAYRNPSKDISGCLNDIYAC